MSELLYEGYQDGFTIKIVIEPEQKSYIDVWGNEDQSIEIQNKIDNGEYYCFIAFAHAFKKGIKLGSANIGMNVYKDPKEFLNDRYAQHLIDEAIENAKTKLKELISEEYN